MRAGLSTVFVVILLVGSACTPQGEAGRGTGAVPPADMSPPASPTQTIGRCGDGVCDDAERSNPALCPQDCQSVPTQTPAAATPTVAPSVAPSALPAPTIVATATLALLSAADLAAGQQFWEDSACAGCHGAQGEGGSGPALAGTTLSWEEFTGRLHTGTLHDGDVLSDAQRRVAELHRAYVWLQLIKLQALQQLYPYAPPGIEPPAEEPADSPGSEGTTPEAGCEPRAYDLLVKGCGDWTDAEMLTSLCSMWSACIEVDQTCQIHGSASGQYVGGCNFTSLVGCTYTANCPAFQVSIGGKQVGDSLWLTVDSSNMWEHVVAVCMGLSTTYSLPFMQMAYGSATRNGGGYFCKIENEVRSPVRVYGPDVVAAYQLSYDFTITLMGVRDEPTCDSY